MSILISQADRDTQLNLRESIKHNIRDQIEQLTGRLEELSGSENQIHSQIDHYNKRLKKIEDSLRKSNNPKEVTLQVLGLELQYEHIQYLKSYWCILNVPHNLKLFWMLKELALSAVNIAVVKKLS